MNFFVRAGPRGEEWVVQFMSETLNRAIGPIRVWQSADVILELIRRTPTKMDLATKQSLEMAFQKGRGGLILNLLPEQYARLHIWAAASRR
jgi:hypothetical protein